MRHDDSDFLRHILLRQSVSPSTDLPKAASIQISSHKMLVYN